MMLDYEYLKMLHVSAAILTFSGFVLRGYWMLFEPALLRRRLVRILPHVIDTVFLASGVGLVMTLRLPWLESPWLLTKIAALLLYIVLGTIALKRGKTRRARASAYVLAQLTFAYIIGVAVHKSAWSWLAAVAT